jgi:hypothetical protein
MRCTSHYLFMYQDQVTADKTYKRKVCVFLLEKNQYSSKTDISHLCNEKHLEVCVIQLETKASNFVILSL